MKIKCENCDRVYDDAERWNICPHPKKNEAVPFLGSAEELVEQARARGLTLRLTPPPPPPPDE